MNINTATLLTMLSPKLNETAKQKIDSLSVDGKVDISTLAKDKGIQTLLSGLFKDISLGNKPKEDIATLLQNNKQNFSFKNLSEDIKTLIKVIQSDNPTNQKLQTQLTSLKSSLIDINNLDEKAIKTSVSNSGVFLESKLSKQSIPVMKNIDQLLTLIKSQTELLLPTQIKSAIETIVNQNNKEAQIDPKSVQSSLQQLNSNINKVQNSLQQLSSNPNIPNDLKQEIKNSIENLLRDIKNIKTEQNPQKQLQTLTTVESKIATIIQNFEPKDIKMDLKNNLSNLFTTLKEHLSNRNIVEIRNNFINLQEKIAVLSDDTLGAKNIKQELSSLLTQAKSLETLKVPQQQLPAMQNLFANTQSFQSRVAHFPQVLFENNISKTANFINDLKITASTIEKQIEGMSDSFSKDLRTVIEKINTQIDFFQLLSYSTNSAHTYLSFLQDEIEDADVKFNKNKDESFSCQINLSLKNYGELKVLMVLDSKNNININIGVEQTQLKSLVQNNLQKLRLGIHGTKLLIQSLNVFSLHDEKHNSLQNSYGAAQNDFSFGLDIKV